MPEFLGPYAQSVLTNSFIMAIAALGLFITVASGQLSVMHAALMGTASYLSGFVAAEFGVPIYLCLVVGAAIAALLGALTAVLALRLRHLLLSIATLVLGQTLVVFFFNFEPFGGAGGFVGAPLTVNLPIAGVVLLAAVAFVTVLMRSPLGLTILAVGRDEIVAASLGMDVARTRVFAFALGGAITGIAGALRVQYLGVVVPQDLSFASEVQLLLFVIIGGMTTHWGAVLGAIAFTVLPEVLRVTTLDRFWILGLLLTATILIKPQGILIRRPIHAPIPLVSTALRHLARLSPGGDRAAPPPSSE